ncbi:MAG: hypothetical protein M3A44_02095 [Gammaproteobacteria bacterium]
MKMILLGLLSLALAACANQDAPVIPPQMSDDVQISVEPRPEIPIVGMNEFLVTATRKPSRPAFDLIVSVRMSESDVWRQAIQDGHVGVYRRALMVDDPATQAVFVRIEQKGKTRELRFPLKVK